MGDTVEAEIQDLLTRCVRSGRSFGAIERAAGLPQAFLTKARRGACRSEKADDSWDKLRRWLNEEGKPTLKLEPDPAALVELPPEIAGEILKVKTFRGLKNVFRALAAQLAAAAHPSPRRARLSVEALKVLLVNMRDEFRDRSARALPAIEILTPQEEAALAEWAAKQPAPPAPPILPEAPKPDPEAEVVKEYFAKRYEKGSIPRAIARCRTLKGIREATQRLAAAIASGEHENPRQAKLALDALKAMKLALRLEREEEACDEIARLHVMSDEELAALDAWRKENAGPPLEPGERVPPPDEAEEWERKRREAWVVKLRAEAAGGGPPTATSSR